MKLDEEMLAAIREAGRGSAIRRDGTTSERIFLAGYRLALERAERVCEATYPEMRGVGEIEQLPCYDTSAECAAAIRALGSEQ